MLIEGNKYIGHWGMASKLSISAELLSSIVLYDTCCSAALSTEFGGKIVSTEVDFSEIAVLKSTT